MEDSKTKYIESSLVAFRTIKSFVFQKGAYPRTFDNGMWKEEDYKDRDYRRVMRSDFEEYLELLVHVYNKYVKTLYDAMPHIESEYNNLVIDSRNMEQALKLFKDKYEEAMFVIEWEMDINKTLGNYLSPLLKHEIIHPKEADGYQEIICNIGMIYCQAVNVVCDVFSIERPWNKNRADVAQIASSQVTEMVSAIQNEAEEPQEPQSANGTSEQIAPKTIKRELTSEFAEYFNAPFKGIGPNNINYYDRLEDSLTDPAKKRSTIEYAKIALFIYQSKKILPRKKPNTFSEWYQYFCKIVGCKYNKDYSPHKLPITQKLKEEFSYLLD